MSIIEVRNLSKAYQDTEELVIFDKTSININEKEFVSLVAPSGNGKSTFIHLLAGLERPTTGSIHILNKEITTLSESDSAKFRRENISLVFQFFNLFSTLNVIENIMLPMELAGTRRKVAKNRAIDMLRKVKLEEKINKFPSQLSGGEQQRVAFARAFAGDSKVILADEPTGNLDNENAQNIFQLMAQLNSEKGTTMLVVTHDIELAQEFSSRIITIKNKKLTEL